MITNNIQNGNEISVPMTRAVRVASKKQYSMDMIQVKLIDRGFVKK